MADRADREMNAKIRAASSEVRIGHAIFAGLAATLVGIGLARFAYTPLIPALIEAAWFSPAEAAYLGAANLAGYLAGALLGRRAVTMAAPATVLRAMMILATLTFFASATPLSFAWFFLWRFLAGLAGGTLMVVAAPTIMPHVPPHRRGLAGGAIFGGVGIGIALSGTLVPHLLRVGLVETWLTLGALALTLVVLAWPGWPKGRALARPPAENRGGGRGLGVVLWALFITYALNAFGLVPHMVFLVDYVARGLELGIDAGGRIWVLFGIGAAAGPLATGHLADRIGFGPALRLVLALQIVAVALPLTGAGMAAVAISAVVIGAAVVGVVPLVFGCIQESLAAGGRGEVEASTQQSAWSLATAAFAIGQATSAYVLSYLFAGTGSYALLFALGAGAIAVALAIQLLRAATVRPADA